MSEGLSSQPFTFMTHNISRLALTGSLVAGAIAMAFTAPAQTASAPAETQVPKKMHAPMKELARVKVGHAGADFVGIDNRALQAAVDYVAALGGGAVEIG